MNNEKEEKTLILASASQARKQILEQAGFSVIVRPTGAFEGSSIKHPGERAEILSGWESSDVTFFNLGSNEIEKYLNAGEWYGAAGSYRVQGTGLRMISSIKGSYFTVAGLPIHKISGILRERGF